MVYDYKCINCDEVKEVQHSIKEEPLIMCDKCGYQMHRIIYGGTTTLYKVSGFTKYKGRNGQ